MEIFESANEEHKMEVEEKSKKMEETVKVGHMEVEGIEEHDSSRESLKKSNVGSHYAYSDEQQTDIGKTLGEEGKS